MFCRKFRDRIYRTVRQQADSAELSWIQQATGIPIERIIMTKCGYICRALDALMQFRNKRQHPLDVPLSSFYGYLLDLEGVTRNGQDSNTDHEMILLYQQGWWIVDSYLGCRELTCRPVDPNEVLRVARALQQKFDEKLWIWLTGCPSTDDPGAETRQMRVAMTEFDYTRL